MGQFTHNGIVYDELPDGTVRVVGYDQQQALPSNPLKVQEAQASTASSQANASHTNAETPWVAPKAQADIRNTSANAAKTIAETPFAAPKAAADAAKAAAEAGNAARTNGLDASVYSKALAQWNAAGQLDRIVGDLRTAYDQGPGATHGVAGLKDFLPTPGNQRFDKSADQARGIVRNALGLTGGEANTAAEMGMNLGGYIPKSSNFDGTNADIFQHLEALRDTARHQAIQTLGGIPDENGRITPVAHPNAMLQPTVTMEGRTAAGAGATTEQVPIPKAMQDEYNGFVAKNLGRLSPDDYATFRAGLDAKYNFGAPDQTKMEAYRKEAAAKNAAALSGGKINTRIPGPPRLMSATDQLRNNLVSSPVGAAAAGLANAGGFGVPEALAGDQYQSLRDAAPVAVGLGEVGGSILGTGLLAKGATSAATRLAPKLLQGGGRAQFARNLATDLAYSGIYGGTTQGDPVTGALTGGVGSVAGQGVGKALGALVGGARALPSAQYLRKMGVGTTVGQTLGGIPKALEDAATSIPGIGDIINNRRLEGLRDFNRVALAKAGEPVKAVTSNYGGQGVQDLLSQIGGAYDNATSGVSMPLDAQFAADVAASRQAGQRLPPDYRPRLNQALNNRIGPIEQAGQLTGNDYQQAVRGIKGMKASASQGAPGFEQDYKGALQQAQDALNGQMQRGGGQPVTEALARADRAYRMTQTLKRATNNAFNGTGSGEAEVFTPAQLNNADKAQEAKYGSRMFADLGKAGQAVLPSKIPDSGTAKRLLSTSLAAGGIGGGYGAYASPNDRLSGAGEGMLAGASAGVLAAIGGTRAGQQLINDALTGRPDAMKRLGLEIRKKQSLLGTAAVPISIDSDR